MEERPGVVIFSKERMSDMCVIVEVTGMDPNKASAARRQVNARIARDAQFLQERLPLHLEKHILVVRNAKHKPVNSFRLLVERFESCGVNLRRLHPIELHSVIEFFG